MPSFLSHIKGRATVYTNTLSKEYFQITKCTDRPHILSPKVNFEFVRIHNLQGFIDAEIGM